MKKLYGVLCLPQAEYLGKLPPSANAALSFPNFAGAKTAMKNILATNSATCGEVYASSGLWGEHVAVTGLYKDFITINLLKNHARKIRSQKKLQPESRTSQLWSWGRSSLWT